MKRLLAAGVTVIGLSLAAQALALLRGLLLISQFGASQRLDAFHLANNTTFAVFNVIDAAILTVLIPHLVKDTEPGVLRRYLMIMVRGSWIGSIALLGVIVVAAPVVAPKFDTATQDLLKLLVAILLIGQQFRAFTSLFTAAQQVQDRFTPSKLAAVISALVPLLYLLVSRDLIGFCVATAISYLAEALLNRHWSRGPRGFTAFGPLAAKNPATSRMIADTYPILLSSGLFQTQVIITTFLLGGFAEGTITHYANASQVVGALQALLLTNLIAMIYPRIAAWVHENDPRLTTRVADLASLLTGLIMFLLTLFWVGGHDAVNVLFLHGNVTPSDTHAIFTYCLWLFAALPASAVRDVLYRVAYARNESRLAGRNSLVVVVANVALLATLTPFLGVTGVFISLVAGSVLSLCLFTRVLDLQGFTFPWLRTARDVAAFFFIGIGSVLCAEATRTLIDHVVASTLVAGAVFVGLASLLVRRRLASASGRQSTSTARTESPPTDR